MINKMNKIKISNISPIPVLLIMMMMSVSVSVFAQNRTIKGSVVDNNSEPLSGATVHLKDTNVGVVTGSDGQYSIVIPAETKTAKLVFSYVGYITKEVEAGSKSQIDVVLNEDAMVIDEVVVVGYGTQKKATLTGAISVIDNKDIITTKSYNIQNSLTGKIAGVKVVEGSSEPGTFETSFSIRGQGEPLVIIDGVPRDNMTRLDPNEVESISILKDASAAIYGTRAANGVVLITTKQGRRDTKFRFDYNGYVGSESFIKDLHLLDAVGYISLMNEKNFNQSIDRVYAGRRILDEYKSGNKQSTDWITPFINEHPLSMQHSLSASGGTKALTYFVNFGYTNREGRWKSDATYYHRFNLRSNVTAQLAKGLEGKVMINLMQEKQRSQPGDTYRIYSYAIGRLPTELIYLPDPNTGEESTDYPYLGILAQHLSLYLDPEKAGYDLYFQRRVQTNMSLEWEIPWITDLKVKGMYSYDFRDDDKKSFRKIYTLYNDYYSAFPAGDHYIRRDDIKYFNSMLQLSLTYKKTFGKRHNVDASLFYEESSRDADNFWVRRETVLSSIEELYAGSNSGIQGTQEPDLVYTYTNKGFIGRFLYNYAEKYIADLSFRYDGSSKFGPGSQWGFFPVGSVAWRVSEESFIKNSSVRSIISNLKLRGNYGVMGDDRSSLFQFVSGYEYPTTMAPAYKDGYYVLNGVPVSGTKATGTANQKITWFTAKTLNLGLDFELWRGLLGGVVEVFQRNRSGLIGTRNVVLPVEAGIDLPDENLNSDLTRGLEITLTHRHKIKNFNYNVSAHIAMDRTMDKYVERSPLSGPYDNWKNNTNDRWSTSTINDNGRKEGSDLFWGTEYLGQFQSMDEIRNTDVVYDNAGNIFRLPGDLIYNDWNHDGIIDGNDDHPIGYKHTTLSYGITVGAAFKGFDLNLVFQGTAGNRKRMSDISSYFEPAIRASNSGSVDFLDRWHRADELNPTIDQEWIPGYYPSTFGDIPGRQEVLSRSSTFWIVDASFLRLKTIEAGYTIPSKLTQKIGIQNMRLFFNGYNMLTFSTMKMVDPEQSGIYPLVKSYNVGLNFTF
jgi:TonB-linked SusC/RagA family outer membrane protein